MNRVAVMPRRPRNLCSGPCSGPPPTLVDLACLQIPDSWTDVSKESVDATFHAGLVLGETASDHLS